MPPVKFRDADVFAVYLAAFYSHRLWKENSPNTHTKKLVSSNEFGIDSDWRLTYLLSH